MQTQIHIKALPISMAAKAYAETDKKRDKVSKNKHLFAPMVILNTVKMGSFGLNRTITDDIDNLWPPILRPILRPMFRSMFRLASELSAPISKQEV